MTAEPEDAGQDHKTDPELLEVYELMELDGQIVPEGEMPEGGLVAGPDNDPKETKLTDRITS